MIRRWLGRALCVLLGVGVVVPMAAIAILRVVPPPLAVPMLMRRAVEGVRVDYRWLDGGRISPHLLRAVVAAEDERFTTHSGFDWIELDSALRAARRGRRLRGASTISMQCARAVFLWPGRSVVRKGIEAYLTLWLEALWPKRRILEVYVNVVEWGDGLYGCEAAARRHLGTSCASLDAEQAARLAAILPSPRRWSAHKPGPYVRRRIATILRRMPRVAVPPRS